MGESVLSWPVMYSAVPGWTKIPLRAWYKEFEWYYPKCEMQVKEWFVCNVKPDWVLFDVGANVGVYSLLFSQLAPLGTVYAFEPTSTYDMLLRNLDYGKAENVIPYRRAVGKEAGDIEERVFRMWGQEAEQDVYHFTTIDAFVREHGIERLDCIKIDVDSFDFEVMQGAVETLERFDPFVMMEINPDTLAKRQVTPDQVFAWLREQGYTSFSCFDGENYLLRKKGNPLSELRNVEIPELPTHMRALVPDVTWPDSGVLAIPPAYDDLQDAPVLRYFYRYFSPVRHLEFGTWKGKGVQRVIEECPAWVWTINLWEGENKPDGYWAYSEPNAETGGHMVRTDAKGMIGRAYIEAGLGSRVNQIYANSLLWEDDVYPNGFFDSVFVDGGHDAATSRADVYKALRLLRPGGLLLLHDFCPLPEVNARYSSTAGVTAMVAAELDVLTKMCDALFWVAGTWILCGIRRRDCGEKEGEWEADVFREARERGRRLAMVQARSSPKMKQRTIWQCAAAELANTWEINSVNGVENVFARNNRACLFQYTDSRDHAATFYVDVPPAENEDSPSVFSITFRFPDGENVFYHWNVQVQNKDCNRIAEFLVKSEDKSEDAFNFMFDNPEQDSLIRLVFLPIGEFGKQHALPTSIHLVWMNVGDKLYYLYRNANILKTSEKMLRGELLHARSTIMTCDRQRNEAVNECSALKEQLGALENAHRVALNEHVAERTALKEQLGALESTHQASLNEHVAERTALKEQLGALESAHHALLNANAELHKRYDALMAECGTVKHERDALDKKFDAVQQERDAFNERIVLLQQEHNAVQRQHTAVRQELDCLWQEYGAMQWERDVLTNSRWRRLGLALHLAKPLPK